MESDLSSDFSFCSIFSLDSDLVSSAGDTRQHQATSLPLHHHPQGPGGLGVGRPRGRSGGQCGVVCVFVLLVTVIKEVD